MKNLLKPSVPINKQLNHVVIQKLYDAYKEDFIRYTILQFHLSEEEGADIYQDSFLAMIENIRLGKYLPQEASLKTYLFCIGRNQICKKLRKKESPLLPWEWMQQETNLNWKKAMEITADLIEENEDSICARILKLFYWKGASMKEIAETMHYQSADVAKNKKSSCLKRFSLALKERLKNLNIHL